ncbi:MAG: OmpH family outer membrane protein [Mucilaginibacter sp.]|jgi:outer membrane protein
MRYVLLTCSIILASIAAKAQTVPATTPATTATNTNAPAVVYVNQDTLLNNYEYFKAIKTKLQDLSNKAQAEISAKGTAFQKEVAAYQRSASSLTPMQKAATEKKLAKKQQDLQTLSQGTAKQLQDMEAEENAKLYDRIATYLKTYTKAKGYKIVLTYSKSNPAMLYGDESLDVTKEVLAGLNEDYKKESK